MVDVNKRFIIVDSEDNFKFGWGAFIEKNYNVLFLIRYDYNFTIFEWEEKGRFIVDGYRSLSNLPIEKRDCDFYSGIDICGQAYDNDHNGNDLSSKTIRDYFGGALLTVNKEEKIFDVHLFISGRDITKLIKGQIRHSSVLLSERIIKNMDGYDYVKKPIPDCVKEAFKEYTYGEIEKFCHEGKYLFNDPLSHTASTFAIMEKCGDRYVYRVFSCFLKPSYYFHDIGARYVEVMRIGLDSNLTGNIVNFLKYPLVWYEEGMQNTNFKYAEKFLSVASFKNLSNLEKNIFCSFLVATNPLIEKILNLNLEGSKKVTDDFKWRLNYLVSSNVNDFLKDFLGPIDENKKQLHQMLGIPKEFLKEICLDGYSLGIVKTYKELIKGNEAYFFHMNSNDVKNVYNAVKEYCHFCFSLQEAIKQLIELFGGQKFVEFVEFVGDDNNISMNEINEYCFYIQKIYVLKDISKNFEWKLKGETLIKTSESLDDAYYTFIDSNQHKQYIEAFKNLSEFWKFYEYENDEFLITYPKTPSELVKEGVELHHCVKDFVELVANGDTIILFVRKKDSPTKPFFTLEIRDSELRQCHGFDNSNMMDYSEELELFVKEFCEQKRIFTCCEYDFDELFGIEDEEDEYDDDDYGDSY